VDASALVLTGLSVVTTGLITGAIFALVAAGVTIVYGGIWLPNAANGQFFMLGGLMMWTLVDRWGWASFPAAVLIVVLSVPFALLLERVLIRQFYEVADRNIVYLVVTLGLAQIFAGLFSSTYGRWSDNYSLAAAWPGMIMLGPFPLPRTRFLVLTIALAILAGLFLLLRLHRAGRALRAVFQNREAAALRGVDVRGIYRFSFVLGTLTVVAGGVLFSMAYSFDLTVAWTMAIIAFAIMIVGGPGSVLGSVVVGMVFGFTQAIVSLFASPTIATFAYLVAMLVILLVKPSGLFSR
jgi:branched-subunit amino acid ABC-type transport system permease component